MATFTWLRLYLLSQITKGQKINTPLPWRLVKDAQVLYQGVTGQDPYHGNYKPSNGFLSGVLQGGFIEWLGGRPIYEDKKK